jgi:hypothetical protein
MLRERLDRHHRIPQLVRQLAEHHLEIESCQRRGGRHERRRHAGPCGHRARDILGEEHELIDFHHTRLMKRERAREHRLELGDVAEPEVLPNRSSPGLYGLVAAVARKLSVRTSRAGDVLSTIARDNATGTCSRVRQLRETLRGGDFAEIAGAGD